MEHKFLALEDKHFPKDHRLIKISTEATSRSITAARTTEKKNNGKP